MDLVWDCIVCRRRISAITSISNAATLQRSQSWPFSSTLFSKLFKNCVLSPLPWSYWEGLVSYRVVFVRSKVFLLKKAFSAQIIATERHQRLDDGKIKKLISSFIHSKAARNLFVQQCEVNLIWVGCTFSQSWRSSCTVHCHLFNKLRKIHSVSRRTVYRLANQLEDASAITSPSTYDSILLSSNHCTDLSF